MTLIDWGIRRVQLLPASSKDAGEVVVTRAMQVRALRPHTWLANRDGEGEMQIDLERTYPKEGYHEVFTPAEATIRDCYDAFLNGLERFASFTKTKLISASMLMPYIGYWIDDVHSSSENDADAAWSASLITYINFYRFDGVLSLFEALKLDIGTI